MSNKSMKQPSTKLDLLIARLRKPGGATIDELQKLTGW